MPKLNTNNKAVIEEILKVCTYWVTEYDIDALRLDVANEISHLLCKELRKCMLLLKSDFYILGDIGVSKTMTPMRFEQELNRCYTMYMKQMNPILFNLLDSHDTIRIAVVACPSIRLMQELMIVILRK